MAASFQVYLVGGAVRDELLHRPVVERDWVVVGAEPQMLLDEGFVQVGKDFPVFLHPQTNEEYALARTERKQGQGYTGFVCDASVTVTLEEDLLRRDLTVNAMAKNAQGDIVDPYGGLNDLNDKVLRHVSKAFSEDPLRVLRVARFAARYAYLGFTVAPETLNLMSAMANSGELATLTAERVWRETVKALQERSPHIFFAILDNCNAISSCFPALANVMEISGLRDAMQALAQDELDYEKQCALVCLALSSHSSVNPLAWLEALKAPKNLMSQCRTMVSVAEVLTHSAITADELVSMFNRIDVWRRPHWFDFALKVLPYAAWLSAHRDLVKTVTILANMKDVATQVSARDVIASGAKGAEIKQAIYQKRVEHVGAALKLW